MELRKGQHKEGELGNATWSGKRVLRPAGTRIWVCLKGLSKTHDGQRKYSM